MNLILNLQPLQLKKSEIRFTRRLDPYLKAKAYLLRTEKNAALIQEIEAGIKKEVSVGCSVMTIGQYLQPTRQNVEVQEYVTPETFAEYARIGLQKGFRFVESGPLVRSSYHAERHVGKGSGAAGCGGGSHSVC